MPLAEWEAKGWLLRNADNKEEILELLENAEGDLMDARRELPPEWSFRLACTAAINLCTALLLNAGYRAKRNVCLKSVRALPGEIVHDRRRRPHARATDTSR